MTAHPPRTTLYVSHKEYGHDTVHQHSGNRRPQPGGERSPQTAKQADPARCHHPRSDPRHLVRSRPRRRRPARHAHARHLRRHHPRPDPAAVAHPVRGARRPGCRNDYRHHGGKERGAGRLRQLLHLDYCCRVLHRRRLPHHRPGQAHRTAVRACARQVLPRPVLRYGNHRPGSRPRHPLQHGACRWRDLPDYPFPLRGQRLHQRDPRIAP